MTEQELLAQLDEQNRIIREQRSHMVLLEERLSEKINSLEIDIERLRKINRESDLIKELREKHKPVTK